MFYHSKIGQFEKVTNNIFFATVEIKDCNAVIDGRNLFGQPVKNNLRTYDNIRKVSIGQADDYIAGCFIDYPYFKNYYKLIAIVLSKQQKLDADPKTIQQINFTGNLDRGGTTQMFFIVEKKERNSFRLFKRIVKVL